STTGACRRLASGGSQELQTNSPAPQTDLRPFHKSKNQTCRPVARHRNQWPTLEWNDWLGFKRNKWQGLRWDW
ncbi:MAG TPA: hypothetical protein PK981_11885, partial [Accumulibacter sp.]|nr:hypothetical protein [Accumulibacter sp.]HNC16968.1 hypothetical protein [Accumulibacter sp.]HND81048.1 hypothetical protein [Accumulibacter sp.]HNG39728.1 hypothetical protein [Accumulibacter sp.]HNK00200.1 hypothetical protein [Accumulibacter sp.]